MVPLLLLQLRMVLLLLLRLRMGFGTCGLHAVKPSHACQHAQHITGASLTGMWCMDCYNNAMVPVSYDAFIHIYADVPLQFALELAQP